MATIIVTSMDFILFLKFPILWFCSRTFTKIFNHVLAKDQILVFLKNQTLLMLMATFYVDKMVEIHHKRTLSYIINIYFKVLDKFNINFKYFKFLKKMGLTLELFMGLKLKFLELFLKFYLLGIAFSIF